MAKNAYLIVSDLHKTYKNLRNRIDYGSEIDFAQMKIIEVAKKYKSQGYAVTVLLLGDVFHNSYNSVFRAVQDNNFFIMLSKAVGRIYSVMGNHELTYYSSNPFYTLISEIKSEKMQKVINRVWTPAGVMPVISVVDELEDGEVIFHFNHYSASVSNPGQWEKVHGGRQFVHIGLFHQEFACSEIIKLMERNLGRSVVEGTVLDSKMQLLDGYSYCFFGHMHSVYGTFASETGTKLCYLASLGRTNVLEVNNSFLQRNIPVITVENGRFLSADDNKFELPCREECVKENMADAVHKKYVLQKVRKKIKDYVPLNDKPQENVCAALAGNQHAVQIFNDFMVDGVCTAGRAVDQEIAGIQRLLHQGFI